MNSSILHPEDEGKGFQETAQQAISAWKESWSVCPVFLFFPTSLYNQVKQSLRVNKCDKDKTNIFSNWIGSFLV